MTLARNTRRLRSSGKHGLEAESEIRQFFWHRRSIFIGSLPKTSRKTQVHITTCEIRYRYGTLSDSLTPFEKKLY